MQPRTGKASALLIGSTLLLAACGGETGFTQGESSGRRRSSDAVEAPSADGVTPVIANEPTSDSLSPTPSSSDDTPAVGASADAPAADAPAVADTADPAAAEHPAGTTASVEVDAAESTGDKSGQGTDEDNGKVGADDDNDAGDESTDATSNPPAASKEIEFGSGVTFHLGDDAFQGSTCISQLEQYPIVGSTFYFDFEVLEDETSVDIEIATLCGVDYVDTNLVSLTTSTDFAILPTAIAKGAASMALPSAALAKGKHSIKIESKENAAHGSDHDDFIVGSIKVRASKPVMPGAVRTN